MSNARDKANIPALNFSSTGIDDNATSTAITIDSSEKVGINSTAPSSDAWTGARTLVIKETDITKDNGITIISSSATNNGNIAFADTSGGGFSDIGGLITYLHNGDSFRFMTANTERMRLNSTGLGIGTSSPGAKLEIQTGSDWGNIINSTYAGTQYFQQFEYNGTSIGKIRGDNSSIAIESGSNLILQTANTERMRIANNGDISFLDSTGATTRFFWDTSLRSIGINTTAPETALHVALSGTNYGGVNAGTEPGHVLTISSAGNGGAGRGTSMVFQSPGSGSSVTTAKIDALQNSQSSIASNANLVFNVANTSGNLTRRLLIGNGGDISFYEDTGTTPKMIWDASAESLSIGSSNNPDENLHIQTSDSTAGTIKLQRGTSGVGTGEAVGELKFATNDTSYTATTSTDEVAKISAVSPNIYGDRYDLAFYTGIYNESTPGERLRITSSGNVLIGTTSAQRIGREKVEIKNTTGEAILSFTNDLSYAGRVHKSLQESGGTHYIDYYLNSDNGNVGAITHNDSSTSFVTSSDYRLKENVVDMTNATDRLKQLQPKRFNFIADADTTVDGFLAHEVQSVVPEAITGTHNEVEVWKEGEELPEGVSVGDNKLDENGNTIPVYQGIDQSKLVPLLVKTIQELEARITALETNQP
jgi:hypothetical protein